ncbi:MAG: hypothetical protein IJ976_07375, partial [Alistipes sp.]|nr:hypothetical protein [Alistipes sp.]
GKETMNENKTIAFQVSPELNQRLKAYLAKHNLKQAHFIIGPSARARHKGLYRYGPSASSYRGGQGCRG